MQLHNTILLTLKLPTPNHPQSAFCLAVVDTTKEVAALAKGEATKET
jgi:hypothetical protein